MTISEVHARLATTALLYAAFLGLWGLFRFFRKERVNSSYWGALFIAEILILIQGGLGAYMYIIGIRPTQGIHLLYGIVSGLAIPTVFALTRGSEERRDMLIYGASLLFIGGLILRAMGTG